MLGEDFVAAEVTCGLHPTYTFRLADTLSFPTLVTLFGRFPLNGFQWCSGDIPLKPGGVRRRSLSFRPQEKKQLVFDSTVGGDAASTGKLTVDDLRFLFAH